MGRKYNDISGNTYDDITVLSQFNKNKSGQIIWECRCKCGSKTYATSTDLKRGRRRYCNTCIEQSSKNSPIKTLFGNYKRNAIIRGYVFELSIEEFTQFIFAKCTYCDTEPKQKLKKEKAKYGITYNGIDRKDNKIGYVKSNCVTSCKFCNLAKNRFSKQEFLVWINGIKGRHI